MDVIYTFDDYKDDVKPRLIYPEATGKNTTYTQWLIYHYRLNYDEPYIEEEPSTVGPAFVNHGRWLWLCPACGTSVQVCSGTQGGTERIFCPACYSQRVVTPQFPDNREEIEEELLRQPGYRWNAPFRNWEPGWSMDYLRERTASAQAQMAAGVLSPRAASIGIPRTWAVGEVLTASNMNTFIREIQRDFRGDNGAVELVHGMRPGTFTTAQIQALTGIVDGVMLYNSTTERHEYFVGGARRGFAGVHTSGLFAAGEVVTVTHDLGFAPTSFQLAYERVASADFAGHSQNDRIFVDQNGTRQAPGFAVFDVTASSYKVAATAARNPVWWVVDDSDDSLWMVDGTDLDSTFGDFGEVGLLPTGVTTPYGAVLVNGDLWTISDNFSQARLWRINTGAPGDETGDYGNQGDLPSTLRIRGPRAITYHDSDFWIVDSSSQPDRLWRIDGDNPGSEAGVYGDQGGMPNGLTGPVGITSYLGDLWVLTATREIWRINPVDPDDVSGAYGMVGTVSSSVLMPRGLGVLDNALWLLSRDTDSLWKIDPTNPSSEAGAFGLQGSFPAGLGIPIALAPDTGSAVQTGYITAASGESAGVPVEIVVDNDAASSLSNGGWGARLLAFA